ncbi:hypothetical protein T05_2674 [Trichinella murrelli]|uniref:Uncharacterized protein n=1 Tax=Trichinella murrelli TaxID=144512 RepID=A0A0V0TBH1_9BILA|nr:hypothetical protein T05_2674 [Trichinella murrelli]
MDEMCALYVSNCKQEQDKYLRMFVMPHLEQTDVNMTKHGRFISHCMWRADAVLNQVCSLTINHHKLSSGIPTGAAAYYHDVYAAHLLNSVLR